MVAMAVGSYLAWVSLTNKSAAGCGVGSGCSTVLKSRWAYWLGYPVSVPAVLVYVALFAFTFLLQKRRLPDDQRGSWAAIIVLSVTIVGAAFWFVSLQVFVIQAFCKYCLTAHVAGFIAALLCLLNIPYATDPDTPMWSTGSGKSGVPRRAMLSLIFMGLAGVAVLAGGQLAVQKELNVVKVGNHAPSGTNQLHQGSSFPAEVVPASPNAHLIAPHTLSLYSNEFVLKFDEVPFMGSPDAPHVIVCLVDYTCVHCRALHPILVKLSQQFSNQIGIICLPVSLSGKCNPFIPRATSTADAIACDYARLGLAVWRANPAVFHQFDDWLFTGPKPAPLNEAHDYAVKLVGADQLDAAMADPWVGKQMLTDCKLHRADWLAIDDSALPQIVLGDAVSAGPINSMEHLQILLNKYLGVNLGVNGL